MHIMKAIARHSGAAQSLIEDDSLQLMFHMVAMGVPTKSEGPAEFARTNSSPDFHLTQLHRNIMQVHNLRNLCYEIFLTLPKLFRVEDLLFGLFRSACFSSYILMLEDCGF